MPRDFRWQSFSPTKTSPLGFAGVSPACLLCGVLGVGESPCTGFQGGLIFHFFPQFPPLIGASQLSYLGEKRTTP